MDVQMQGGAGVKARNGWGSKNLISTIDYDNRDEGIGVGER